MIRIVLTEEQSELVAGTTEPIDLVDRFGRMVGRVNHPNTPDAPELSEGELAEIRKRMQAVKGEDATFHTWQEMKAHLQTLGQE